MAFLSGIGGALGGVGLGAAIVEVAVDTTPLKAGLAEAKAQVASSSTAMSASSKAIGTGFIIAGAAAVIGLGKAVSATEELGTATLGLQRVTGQSAESASSLLFVADKLGVSAQSLTQGFGLLEKNISKGSTTLAKYGLELTNSDGTFKDFNTVLGIAADKYLALGGAQQGAAFAQELFGRGGKALIPILEQGSAGIAALEEEAKRYGIVLSQGTVTQVLELAKAHHDLDSSIQGLQVSIGTQLVPVLTTFVHGLTDAIVVFNKIPGPVKAVALGFVVLTGGLFLLQKAQTLVAATWAPVIASMKATEVQATQLTLALDGTAGASTVASGSFLGLGIGAAKATLGIAGMAYALGSVSAVPTDKLDEFNKQLADATNIYIAGNIQALGGLDAEVKFLTDSFGTNTAAVKYAITNHVSYADALKALGIQAGDTASAVDSLRDPVTGLTADETALAAATQAVADAQKALVPDLVSVSSALKAQAADHRALAKMQQQGHDTGARFNDLLLQTASDTQTARQAVAAFAAAQDTAGTSNKELAAKLSQMVGGNAKLAGSFQGIISKLVGVKNAAGDAAGALNSIPTQTTVRVDIIERLIRAGL